MNEWDEISAHAYAAQIAHHNERIVRENIEHRKRLWWQRKGASIGVPIPPEQLERLYDEYVAWLVAMGYESSRECHSTNSSEK